MNTPGYIVVVVSRDGRVVHNPQDPHSCGEYPWDWCFIGAAEENVHSPDEKVHKKDVEGMIALYWYFQPITHTLLGD